MPPSSRYKIQGPRILLARPLPLSLLSLIIYGTNFSTSLKTQTAFSVERRNIFVGLDDVTSRKNGKCFSFNRFDLCCGVNKNYKLMIAPIYKSVSVPVHFHQYKVNVRLSYMTLQIADLRSALTAAVLILSTLNPSWGLDERVLLPVFVLSFRPADILHKEPCLEYINTP